MANVAPAAEQVEVEGRALARLEHAQAVVVEMEAARGAGRGPAERREGSRAVRRSHRGDTVPS